MRLASVPLTVLLAVLVLAGCVSRVGGPVEAAPPTPSDTPTSRPPSSVVADPEDCAFVENPAEDAPVGLPPGPDERFAGGTVSLETNRGELTLTLTAVGTPCTVASFLHLVRTGFYDGTSCHRLTAAAGLKVLQCGDPRGDGTGGPGYTIPDEPAAPLAPVPDDPTGRLVVYQRGMVAMAKTAEPDSGGSQFFMVYGDSTLPPEYTVFGTVDDAGLATLDAIAAAGVAPDGPSPEDGPPAQPVVVESATVV